MKTIKIRFSIIAGFLISCAFILSTADVYGQGKTSAQQQAKLSKNEAIRKIRKITDEGKHNRVAVKHVLDIAKKSELNFDTYVHIAGLVNEFGYHTDPLVQIARYASMAKVESAYYVQLADLVVMKLSETQEMVDIAKALAKPGKMKNEEIDRRIKEIKGTCDFKTMDEAKVHNKVEMDRILR